MRRSKRVVEQVLKKRDTAIIQESTTLAETDSVKDKSLQKEEAYVCSGCKLPSPRIKRFVEEPWIQCDVCNGWWHLECACLTPESGKLINKKKLYFPCAFCVLESLNTRPLVDTCSQTKEKTFQSSQKLESQKQQLQPTKLQAKTKTDKKVTFGEQVIIIDSIDNPSGVSDSRKINEKLKSSCLNTDYVEFAYPLAKGGVAVHFKDSYQAEEAINSWPGKVFGEKESVHRPRGNSGSKVGFVKNVDPRYSKQQILQILKDKGCTVSDVKRLFHRNTGRPMPVVKIFHESHDNLVDTINTELGLKFNGKQTYVESERRRKVVRCFNCMRFGHIGSTCLLLQHCENCGEEHSATNCSNSPKCFNCGGSHKASSSKCTVYQTKLREIQVQDIV